MLSLLYPLSLLALAAAQSLVSSVPAEALDEGQNSSNTTGKFWIDDVPMTIGNGTEAHFDRNRQGELAIWLRNPDLSLTPNDFALPSHMSQWVNSSGVSLPYGTLPGDNYVLILTTIKNRSDVVATTKPFSIYAPGSTSNKAAGASGLTSADVSPPHGWTFTTFSLPSPHYYWVEGGKYFQTGFGKPGMGLLDDSHVDMWIANANPTVLAANVTIATNISGTSVTTWPKEIGNATAGSKYFLVLTPNGDKNFDNALAYSSYFDIKPKGTKPNIDDQALGGFHYSAAARLGAGYAAVLAAMVAAVACVF